MPLSDRSPDEVVFIIGWRTGDSGVPVKRAIGTGFLVSVPVPNSKYVHVYVVTAAHVVRSEQEHWVRFNTKDGGVVDMDGPEWVFHPTQDVAIAKLGLPDGALWFAVQIKDFLDGWLAEQPDAGPALGEKVYFLGLLANMTAMAEANIPMVRSGTIGRLYQKNVPVRLPDDTIIRVTGHLIDCRSYGGFSGSPCFTQYRWWYLPSDRQGALGLHRVETKTLLMGVVSAHFDDWTKARVSGDLYGSVETPVNTGVGIVTPVEAIREVLQEEDVVEERRKMEEKFKREEGGHRLG